TMKPHVSGITLGVKDVNRAKQFYNKGLGWPIQQDYQGQWVSFSLNNGSSTLGLRPWDVVAGDAGLAPDGSGFRGLTFSYDVGHPLGRGPASAVLSFEIADSQPARYPNQTPFGQVLGNGRRQLSPGDHIDEVSFSIPVGAGRSAGDGQDKPGPGNPLTRRPHLRISSQATDQHDLNTSPPERFGRLLPGIRSDHEDGVDESTRPWSPGAT